MADTTFIRILTKRDSGAHAETELTIDWEGMTHEEIKNLAQAQLVQRVQASYRAFGIPGKDTVRALDFIHRSPGQQWELKPQAVRKKEVDTVDTLLSTMSDDEKAQLLAMLK